MSTNKYNDELDKMTDAENGSNSCDNNQTTMQTENLEDYSQKSIKSTAVVKYCAVPTPATFAELQCNTNLNVPPSNWLSTSAESYGLQNVWSRSTGFSSFRMAHMFPDCVGEVDVVSDAENIKKLLKIPYSNGLVSMIVHRVENTLLLDEFDIHKYLLRQAEDDWDWLKQFFRDHLFENLREDKWIYPKVVTRNTLQQKNLISKFLYHSIILKNNESNQSENKRSVLPIQYDDPGLPEPSKEEEVPDPYFNHDFARNVVWTFENIQMLLGTDMPIFGGETHPCISLRLRDMTKPINVLTGIDYWLDNLMCNVPEVVMCYHLDGIVQKYELIKTEDLPNLQDAKFNPKVIKDIAQNILSFLKNNATKAGHTYWLFKGKNDDVVKLYDLSSICNDMSEDKNQNPFTVPVAMLLYRVARNMKYSTDYHKNRGTIRMLLKNCINLLQKEKYPQIVTSAHYMLADLYVPDNTDPSCPNLPDNSDEEDANSECGSNAENDSNDDKSDQDINAAIKWLALTNTNEVQQKGKDFEGFKYRPPPITGTVEEICQSALEHVSWGLECLKYFPDEESNNDDENKNNMSQENKEGSKSAQSNEEETVKMAKPFEAIPMPYYSLEKNSSETSKISKADNKDKSPDDSSPISRKKNKSKKRKSEKAMPSKNTIEDTTPKALLCKLDSQTLPTWQAPKKDESQSWKTHLKILLHEKALLVFAVQAENEYFLKNYGTALKHIVSVLRSQKILEVFCGRRNNKLISYLLGRAGDCCFMLVQDWNNIEKHSLDYEVKNVIENTIVAEIFSIEDLDLYGAEILPENFESIEGTLVASFKCYEKALSLEPSEIDKNNLLRRLGNIHNELGVLYMNQAGSHYQKGESSDDSADVTSPLVKSLNHLEEGVKAFEAVHDEANLALLHSNTGRLMRICAHMNTKQHTRERHFYNKALASYQKALQVLGTRKTNPIIWDSVTWDLSTTLFTMATYLQDFPTIGNKTEEELEKEVVEIFQKALKYCDVETSGPRQPIYQFRAATIQHRLASLYHKVYRELDVDIDSVKRKNSLQLSKLYYEKAAKLLLSLEQAVEFLTVQMERVALAEYQAQISTAFHAKIKSYHYCLELILQCKDMVNIIIERRKNISKQESSSKQNVSRKEEKEKDDESESRENKLKGEEKNQDQEEENLILLLEQRLQFILRSLTKICMNKSQKKENENTAAVYKQCYGLTLHAGSLCGIPLMQHIYKVLEQIEKLLEDKKHL